MDVQHNERCPEPAGRTPYVRLMCSVRWDNLEQGTFDAKLLIQVPVSVIQSIDEYTCPPLVT